ncbi:MAG: 3-dehydroquinate synthase [Thermodesulfobacteriota bacterium]
MEKTAAQAYAAHIESFAVSFRYPVDFTRDAFDPENQILVSACNACGEPGPFNILFFLDSGVADKHPTLPERINAYCAARPDVFTRAGDIVIVPGGEQIKQDRKHLFSAIEKMATARLCRHSFVAVVGGGSVLDVVGLAASLVHRGLRLIRLPSTVLAQSDAGVGVKNGMDDQGMKNFLGVFAPPFAVINDFTLLSTLDDENWVGGLSEAFKVAIIKDHDFFSWLSRNAEGLGRRDMIAMEEAVHRTAVLHLRHIAGGGDPFEFGTARPLDFGHWSAHRLETLSGYSIGHGQAVSMGIALDTVYAQKKGLIRESERDQILAALSRTGLPVYCGLMARREPTGELSLCRGLRDFQEHLGGELCITLPRGIGDKVEVHEMDLFAVEEAVAFLAGQ